MAAAAESAMPSGHRQLCDDCRVLRSAGMVCGRRYLEPGAELSFQAVPDRGAGDSLRVLFSPGRYMGVNAGEKMHRRTGVKMHHGRAASWSAAFQFD